MEIMSLCVDGTKQDHLFVLKRQKDSLAAAETQAHLRTNNFTKSRRRTMHKVQPFIRSTSNKRQVPRSCIFRTIVFHGVLGEWELRSSNPGGVHCIFLFST
jgi:hypothetical protein